MTTINIHNNTPYNREIIKLIGNERICTKYELVVQACCICSDVARYSCKSLLVVCTIIIQSKGVVGYMMEMVGPRWKMSTLQSASRMLYSKESPSFIVVYFLKQEHSLLFPSLTHVRESRS